MADNVYEPGDRRRRWLVAFGATLGLLGLLVLQDQLVGLAARYVHNTSFASPVRLGLLILAGLVGIVAIREALAGAFAGVHKRQGVITWRNLLAWALYVLLLVALLDAGGVKPNTILLGGAVASIVLATLAQASLSSIFAGLVLLIARPYRVGEQVYLRSGNFGGAEYEGIVVDIGALYTILSARGELIKVPNTAVISSVLMTRYRPRRAEVELELPAHLPLDGVEDQLRNRLSLRPGSRIRLEPLTYTHSDGEASIRLRLSIFADEPVDAKSLIAALEDALEPERMRVRSAALR